MYSFTVGKGKTMIKVSLKEFGSDILLLVSGGDEHIGSVVAASPGENLKKDGRSCVTSSTYNFIGHRDEALIRFAAENIASRLNRRVVAVGGFHIDDISSEELETVLANSRNIADMIVSEMEREI